MGDVIDPYRKHRDPYRKYRHILDAYTVTLAGRDPETVDIQDLLPGIFKAAPDASIPEVVEALRWGSRQARREADELGREDFRPPRLPSWRRFEYRKSLKSYAEKHGEHLTDEDANYKIDCACGLGQLDIAGPTIHGRGSRDEIVDAVLQESEKWGMPVTRANAERIIDEALYRQYGLLPRIGRFLWSALLTIIIVAGMAIVLAVVLVRIIL